MNCWVLDSQRGLSNYLKLQLHVWQWLAGLGETLRTGKPKVDLHPTIVIEHSEAQKSYAMAMLD